MNTYSRIKDDAECYMEKLKHIIDSKHVHDLSHALTVSYTDETPFYVRNRVAVHSSSYKFTFDKYITDIKQEIFRLLATDPSLENPSVQLAIQVLQQLNMKRQWYLYQMEYDMNIEYLIKIVAHPSPVASLICREKLKYYKTSWYLGMDPDHADGYLRFLETNIVTKYGKEFLHTFDALKAKKIGMVNDTFPDTLRFVRCVDTFKKYLASK
jgi:hypothetical protein